MNTNTAVQKAANPGELSQYLSKSRSAIEAALPKHLNPERMIRLALTCFSTNPQLRKCSMRSILSSVVVSSQLGLEPGIAGQAYLIPYGETCTLVPGWQGLVGLLNNTGRATAWTGAVFEGDHFEFELGSTPKCRHIPGPNYGDPDMLKWAYACGKVNGSEQPVVEAWPVARVVKHRDRYNKVGQRHYSYENFEMYARKVVLLQVLKYMPRSIELNNAIVASDAAEMGRETSVEGGVVIEMEQSDVPQVEAPKFLKPQGATEVASNPDGADTAKVVQEPAKPARKRTLSSQEVISVPLTKTAAAAAESFPAATTPVDPLAYATAPAAMASPNSKSKLSALLDSRGVKFDDLCYWLGTSERDTAAGDYKTVQDVPEAVAAGLVANDAADMQKFLAAYATKP